VKVKMMPRGEYLKYYAKDEEGNYIGSEEPAEDCSLRSRISGGEVWSLIMKLYQGRTR
jgi:hypothetical protein